MAKKKPTSIQKRMLDPLSFMHQPHDKYVRFVLQSRAVAVQFIQFSLKQDVLGLLDLDTLSLSEDSFIDSKLRSHFSDICYTGQTRGDRQFRVTLIFEHKSEKPNQSILAQLNRYISNVWNADLKQGRTLSLTIPILIYHGKEPIEKETPAIIFPGAPEILLSYVPSFDYELIDITHISDETLEHLEFLLIRNILLALKYSRDAHYVDKNWKKIIIFAPEIRDDKPIWKFFRQPYFI